MGNSFPERAQIPSFSPFHWPSPTFSLSLAMPSNTYPIFHAHFCGGSDVWLELELRLRFWRRSWCWLWFDKLYLLLRRFISVPFLPWYSIAFIDIHGISFVFLGINWTLLLCIGIQEILSMFIHGQSWRCIFISASLANFPTWNIVSIRIHSPSEMKFIWEHWFPLSMIQLPGQASAHCIRCSFAFARQDPITVYSISTHNIPGHD
jgi:hypothetical protein